MLYVSRVFRSKENVGGGETKRFKAVGGGRGDQAAMTPRQLLSILRLGQVTLLTSPGVWIEGLPPGGGL